MTPHFVSIPEAIFGLWAMLVMSFPIWGWVAVPSFLICLFKGNTKAFWRWIFVILAGLHILVIAINVNGQYAPVKSDNPYDQFDR